MTSAPSRRRPRHTRGNGRRRTVHHRVGVLDAHAVRAAVGLDDVHHGVVGAAGGPVALPLEHHRERRHRLGAGLDHALHRVVVRELADVAAAVLDDVDLVAVVDRLDGRQRDAGLGPQPGQHDLLPAGLLDRGRRSSRRPTSSSSCARSGAGREHGLDLRPQLAAERLGFHRRQTTVGTSKTRAAFARIRFALMIDCRSASPTPNSICGCRSIMVTTQLSGVSRPFSLSTGRAVFDMMGLRLDSE